METEESIHVLRINRYDGEEEMSESVIACRDEKALEAYQMILETNSAIIREKVAVLKEEKDKLIRPLWKEKHRLMGITMMPYMKTDNKEEERQKLVAEERRFMMEINTIKHDFNKKKCAVFKEFGLELHDCYIDDEDTTWFDIYDLEVLKG